MENNEEIFKYGKERWQLNQRLLLNFLKILNRDVCFVCDKKIRTVEQMSNEHIIPWKGSRNPFKYYGSVDNIAFSHMGCNGGRKKGIAPENFHEIEPKERCCECDKLIEFGYKKNDAWYCTWCYRTYIKD